jgi:hypothetical protein
MACDENGVKIKANLLFIINLVILIWRDSQAAPET